MKVYNIERFRWRHPVPSVAIAWKCEYDEEYRDFLLCITWWKWCAVWAWSRSNNSSVEPIIPLCIGCIHCGKRHWRCLFLTISLGMCKVCNPNPGADRTDHGIGDKA